MQDNYITNTDQDGAWKRVITHLFKDFVAFFLADLYPQIDFSQEIESLEQEFDKVDPNKENKGKSFKDKLVKVKLLNGEDQYILIHVEVQASKAATLPERMFKYFYRIRDKYQEDITAIAIYTGNDVPRVYDRHEYEYSGTKIIYEFNAYLVKTACKDELLESENPFALVVLAAPMSYCYHE